MGKEKKKSNKEGANFNIGLGGLFGGLGGIIESISKLGNELEDINISKEGEISGMGDKIRGHYGFTINTMGGGKVKVEPFGNIHKTEKGPVVEEEREPLVDIFNEKSAFKIVAELPGVAEDELSAELNGDILTISAKGKLRKYHKEILLPDEVKTKTMTKSFKNGILDISFNKS